MADAADSKIERKYRGLPRNKTLEVLNRTMMGLVALGLLAVLLATLVVPVRPVPREVLALLVVPVHLVDRVVPEDIRHNRRC
jgi:hypothetical protein